MNRYFVLLAIFFSIAAQSVNAQDMAAVFTTMPDQFIPQLESAWRKDLVDLYRSDKEAKLKNIMNGVSELKKLTPDFLELQSTDRCTIQMKLLPLINHTHIICMVTTVYGPVADSRINFYTTEWQPLDKEDLIDPVSESFFYKKKIDRNSASFIEAYSQIEMNLYHYHLDPDHTTLSVEYTTPQYLGKEGRKQLEPFLNKELLVYKWNKSRFK